MRFAVYTEGKKRRGYVFCNRLFPMTQGEKNMDYITNLSASQLTDLMAGGVIGAILGSIATVGALLSLAYWVLNLIGCWKVYGKFGEPGWKCLIPVYNSWVEFKYTWKPIMAIWNWVLALAGSILMECFQDNAVLCLIGIILTIASGVLTIIGYHKLSKAFGHGAGFTLGMVLFTGLFQIILGFGKSQYVGNSTEEK